MLNYIQVEDKFYKVTLDDKGAPLVKECTPEEAITVQFENIAFLDQTVVDTSLLQEIVDRTQADMGAKLEASLKNLVLSALGFARNDRDGYVIAGFNDDKSPVGKHITKILESKILNIDLHKEFNLTPHEIGKLKIAMTNKFKTTYIDHMNGLVWRAARDLAEKHVKEGIEEIAGTKLKAIAQTLLNQAVIKQNEKNSLYSRELELREQVRDNAKKNNDDLE